MLQYIFQHIWIQVYAKARQFCLRSVEWIEWKKQSTGSARIGILKRISEYLLKTAQFGRQVLQFWHVAKPRQPHVVRARINLASRPITCAYMVFKKHVVAPLWCLFRVCFQTVAASENPKALRVTPFESQLEFHNHQRKCVGGGTSKRSMAKWCLRLPPECIWQRRR